MNPQTEATTEVASRAWLREACLHQPSVKATSDWQGTGFDQSGTCSY